MDGSKSRKSDIAATRKRRSSILKSQRPPRTPFSEVEFNVATPPDAAKSRRVSFSRRNGVAEFEITEATTAWKNVYEEHNKSMESSVNESDGKQKTGQRVGHLGSRLTDFQFQDAEADIINTGSRDQLITSGSVDAVATTSDDKSISAPFSGEFEFTEFTEQQTNQLFDNDANPLILETSDHIEVDFSAVASIGNNYEVIDNIVQERKGNTSYVDVDLNCTHFSIKGEASMSDMSITDTIHSPKVAASNSAPEEVKSNESDWVADKENIVVNPYVAPQPADNFAVSDELDDVLVFDGKKCKFQSNLSCITSADLSASNVKQDDLKPHVTQKWKTIVYDDDGDMSVTQALPSQVILQGTESRELADIVYDDDFHISKTRAVSSNGSLSSQPETSTDKQKTVFFDDFGDITVTQALPSNILSQRVDASIKSTVHEYDDGNISLTECISSTCGKTILFKDEDGDISMTQAIPSVLGPKMGGRRHSTVDGNVDGIIFMSGTISAKIKSEAEERSTTILYKNEDGDLSMTQAIPNVLGTKMGGKRKSTVDGDVDGHISMTGTIAAKTISEAEERSTTILYKNEDGDLSMTQAIPNFLGTKMGGRRKSTVDGDVDGHISMTGIIAAKTISEADERSTTILYKNEDGDISMTQAIPNVLGTKTGGRRISTVDGNVAGHISMTGTIAAKKISEAEERSKTILYKNEDGGISMTEVVPVNALRVRCQEPERRRTIVYENNAADISMTQTVNNVILQEINLKNENSKEDITNINTCQTHPNTGDTAKRRTILFSSNEGDVSITQALSANLIVPDPSVTYDEKSFSKDASEVSEAKAGSVDLANHKNILNTTELTLDEDGLVPFNVDRGNFEIISARKSNVYSASHTQPDMSITEDIPLTNISSKNTSVNDENSYSMSITKPIPTHMISIDNELDDNLRKYKTDGLNGGNYSAEFNQTDRGVLVFDAAIKLDILKEDPIEETVSENGKSSIPSKLSGEKKPEIMEEEEEENSSAESMIEVRSGSSYKDCDGEEVRDKVNSSILNDLLDMTNATGPIGDAEADDNNLFIKSNSSSSDNIAETNNLKKITESYLVIKDSDEEQGDQARKKAETVSQGNESSLSDNSKTIDGGIVGTIRYKLGELRDFINRTTSPKPTHHCRTSSAQEDDVEREEANTTMGAEMPINSNDTKAILDLLSQFTEDPLEKDSNGTIASPLEFTNHKAIEYKIEVDEPPRRSLVPDRKSMVRCREDLLKDISMAQAMMKYESDETEEVAADSPGETHAESFGPGPGSSVSNDVVKHLKFDEDDSMLESAPQQPVPYTPLKKTAFGETAYMQDQDYSKAKVIPGYLSDLSDELKLVMNDLTKPMVNDTPLNKSKPLQTKCKKSSSTCSTQIQANLIKSSQIDLDADMLSCSPDRSHHSYLQESGYKLARPDDSKNIGSPENYEHRVIVFDHRNPLNNVLLPPIDDVVTHSYNPRISYEDAASFRLHNSAHDAEKRKSKRDTESRVALCSLAPSPGAAMRAAPSAASDVSHPASVEQAVGAMQDLRDTEANTVIAMKVNKELLETSSSLTLVDDAPSIISLDCESDLPSRKPLAKAAVQVIYHVKEQDSDLTSNDEDMSEVLLKAKKRIYSPQRDDKNHRPIGAEADMLTPKPASKVQKVSSSPKEFKKVDWVAVADRTTSSTRTTATMSTAAPTCEATSQASEEDPIEDTKPHQKSGTVVVVQHLLPKYGSTFDEKTVTNQVTTDINHSSISTCTTDVLSESAPEAVGQHLSAAESLVSGSRPTLQSDSEGLASETGRSDWQPELVHEMSSKNLVTECESGVNVVAKIDVLPFMGSSECEWESRGADAWSFRLLRARLRLVVRLEPRPEAARGRVRADTRVRAVLVEQAPLAIAGKENPIAVLCVKFAAEAMRYLTSRECSRAGDVPALLRRCAGVARVAVRWGRAMHTARTQLAYTLTEDGALSLKVANVPMRSVWEVTMRVELVVADARETPWPRAGRVRVARIVSDWPVPARELRRVLHVVPADWGHVPRTVWKLFKYLKSKTVDEDLLLGL